MLGPAAVQYTVKRDVKTNFPSPRIGCKSKNKWEAALQLIHIKPVPRTAFVKQNCSTRHDKVKPFPETHDKPAQKGFPRLRGTPTATTTE